MPMLTHRKKSDVSVDMGLTAELIIQTSASVEAAGGFQFSVADGSTGLSIELLEALKTAILPLYVTANIGSREAET